MTKTANAPSDLVMRVIRLIDQMIGRGELVPGQRIPESQICQRLDIGRVPVREAMRILAGRAVVELVANRGARVRLMDRRTTAEMVRVLGALLACALDTVLFATDYDELIAELESRGNAIVQLADGTDTLAIMRGIGGYHWRLTRSCRNAYLCDLLQRMHAQHYYAHVIEAAGHDSIARSARRYGELTAALRRRDIEDAKDLADLFVRQTVRAIERGGTPRADGTPGEAS